jgi:hypothetical protein
MNWAGVAMGIIPSLGLLWLFWFTFRGIIRADRREREALAQLDREEAEKAKRMTDQHTSDGPKD